ncbi:histidine--tRNA ligase [Tenacibaculum piscium]|uniref:Histidine--tRNA ligase n=1 Tax=Tenacibaculum piscium TaxID=1458515 RepID=A0A2H1YF26_9FLAO|nr:histidine--tRNA ligase [Tenacibaculum piscium]MBE7628943.1 histidine--tRNA ligase [Tenacibaculum piscium]MBE7671246.1 histidine--tRNA ligase [Tenacibaculum piscium]MBE7685036.1 histidine--tRNA ligase [Tenacibaculum piscium]SOS74104.1 Histidine--tRNA ligase [Tenacibaculum piscium]
MKPSIPKGTRDFSSTEVAKRNYIFNVIKHSFENFGFQPIETPSFENSSTLMGKYGEEGDRLIFKILNSGDYLNKADEILLSEKNSQKVTAQISEKALRYDLTVPFARYVVQHQNDITFPFKRYQIQPVWRADRPQKGRFREFYQCDADVVGSTSLLQEIEFVQLYDTVFSKLGLHGTTIKINNRKILSGIAEVIGASDKLIDFTVALDKLDKIGKEGVVKEMLEKGISENAIEKVAPLFSFSGTNQDKLNDLEAMLQASEEGLKGVEELRTVVNMIQELGLASATLVLDVTLARGLNYYTGAIYEVAAPKEVKMGSIGGGGRYDDLTGIFGLKDVSGVGISFGLDRIYLVMEELNLFETVELPKPRVLFLNFEASENLSKIKAIKNLRENNIKSELYPDTATSNKQQKKQWKYVSSRGIEFVVTDVENDVFVLKNMINGEQTTCSLAELKKIIS